jgi:hypothetical protein
MEKLMFWRFSAKARKTPLQMNSSFWWALRKKIDLFLEGENYGNERARFCRIGSGNSG